MAKTKTEQKDDPGLKQRQEDAERTIREAEEGTGTKQDKGYSGSGDHFVETGTAVDPGQSSKEQQQRQERGEPINEE